MSGRQALPIDDCNVLAFDETRLLQALTKSAQTIRYRFRRSGIEEPNDRHHRLLGVRNKRPRCSNAAENSDEFAPLHCRMPPVLATQRIARPKWQEIAALRNFNPAYVRLGVTSTHPRCLTAKLQVPP